jgi:hypothetical protein
LTKRRQVVVVDGSNLATEGRSEPSLRQLEEAVKAFAEEHPDTDPVVVVDATFEHRVAAAERDRVRQLDRTGEIVSPPAGTVGRGDAFILQIAKRSNAVVLSNDSFQEFHAEHPWLFDEGRLLGGKPVPRVGWIFTARNPVRGQKSRTAIKKASLAAAPVSAPAPHPAPARTASKKALGTAPAKATRGSKKAASSSKDPAAPHKEPVAPTRAQKRAETAQKAPKRGAAAPGKRAAKTSSTSPGGKTTSVAPTTARRKPEPVNTPRSFLRLVSDHRLGEVVDGDVVQFTSHGAMVAVRVGKTMQVVCYAPLAGLGEPPPTRARDVLKKGATNRFRIVAFDAERRRAELALAAS